MLLLITTQKVLSAGLAPPTCPLFTNAHFAAWLVSLLHHHSPLFFIFSLTGLPCARETGLWSWSLCVLRASLNLRGYRGVEWWGVVVSELTAFFIPNSSTNSQIICHLCYIKYLLSSPRRHDVEFLVRACGYSQTLVHCQLPAMNPWAKRWPSNFIFLACEMVAPSLLNTVLWWIMNGL